MLVLMNSVILFINALLVPGGKVLGTMFFVEMITFGLVFNMPGRQTIRFEIFALLATLGQILLSSIFLIGACQLSEKAVCRLANFNEYECLENF